ncbi:MAG: amidohydrolase family protein [Clostridia bacterium]|nr:amidohydrolase family protein [Clostridia bacterium]
MILTAQRMITGDGTAILENQAVLVREGRIARIAPLAVLEAENADEPVVSFEDCTLLPGLIDMHVHLGNWGNRPGDYRNNDYMHAYVAASNARSVLKNGVTTIRDASTKNRMTASLRDAAQNGWVQGPLPRMITCGNGLCMTGGHGSEIPDGGEEVDGPWAIRQAIRRNFKNGCDWIKVLTSSRAHIPEFTQEELDAAVDECHRRGRKIAVHSGVIPTIQMCIDAGFDTIEHGTYMTVEQARQMKEKGLAWVPTITPYTRSARRMEERCKSQPTPANLAACRAYTAAAEAYKENFKKLFDTGVLVGAGTDLSLDEGDGAPVAGELAYMVAYGITPMQAMQVGTSNGARILGLQEETGLLKEGLAADLLIVRGDPSQRIEALAEVEAVYRDGVRAI